MHLFGVCVEVVALEPQACTSSRCRLRRPPDSGHRRQGPRPGAETPAFTSSVLFIRSDGPEERSKSRLPGSPCPAGQRSSDGCGPVRRVPKDPKVEGGDACPSARPRPVLPLVVSSVILVPGFGGRLEIRSHAPAALEWSRAFEGNRHRYCCFLWIAQNSNNPATFTAGRSGLLSRGRCRTHPVAVCSRGARRNSEPDSHRARRLLQELL